MSCVLLTVRRQKAFCGQCFATVAFCFLKGATTMEGNDPGDNPSGPRRNLKPKLKPDQQQVLVKAIEKIRQAHNAGRDINDIAENMAGSIYDIRELMGSTSDAVDFVTTLVVHGSMKLELASFLGIGPMKKQTLEDVLDIQKGSGKQALNISPKALLDLCCGLSKELVQQIDGVDYAAPAKTAQQTTPQFKTAEDILAYVNRKPEPVRKTGPVYRVWGYASHGKTILDLLNVLPESLGKTTASSGGRPKDKDATTGRPKDKDETGSKGGRPKDKDEGGASAGSDKLPTKAKLIAHLNGLNGETDTAVRDRIVKGLKGSKTVDWALSEMGIAGIPAPKA